MKRLLAAAIGAVAMLGILAGPASAAVEFGDTCTGTEVAPGTYTLMTLDAPGSITIGSPIDGVITKLKVRMNLIGFEGSFPTLIKTLKPAGGNSYTVVEQTTVELRNGLTEVAARLPVKSGYRLGLHGLPFVYEGTPMEEGLSIFCENTPESVLGAIEGDVPPGSTVEFFEATEGRVPIAAVVEPDVDNDGYGDETQDKCPQSAAFQIPCPVVTVDSVSVVGKTKVIVYVATSNEAPVNVGGIVKLGKGKTAKLSGGTQTVVPGNIAHFTLKFSKALKAKLKELPKGKKLTLQVTASATNVAGQVSTDVSTAKLKGQLKPKK